MFVRIQIAPNMNIINQLKALGTMTTIAEKNCECGFPMIELVACRSCGNMMLEGENTQGKITQKATKGYEAFK